MKTMKYHVNNQKTDLDNKISVIKSSYRDIYDSKDDDISNEFCIELIRKGFKVVKDELLNYTYSPLFSSGKSGVTEIPAENPAK